MIYFQSNKPHYYQEGVCRLSTFTVLPGEVCYNQLILPKDDYKRVRLTLWGIESLSPGYRGVEELIYPVRLAQRANIFEERFNQQVCLGLLAEGDSTNNPVVATHQVITWPGTYYWLLPYYEFLQTQDVLLVISQQTGKLVRQE